VHSNPLSATCAETCCRTDPDFWAGMRRQEACDNPRSHAFRRHINKGHDGCWRHIRFSGDVGGSVESMARGGDEINRGFIENHGKPARTFINISSNVGSSYWPYIQHYFRRLRRLRFTFLGGREGPRVGHPADAGGTQRAHIKLLKFSPIPLLHSATKLHNATEAGGSLGNRSVITPCCHQTLQKCRICNSNPRS
jgi:hypothetical protein